MKKDNSALKVLAAALFVSSAAIAVEPQSKGRAVPSAPPSIGPSSKVNKEAAPASPTSFEKGRDEEASGLTKYEYEFKKAEFFVRRISITYDAKGHGKITFERQGEDEPVTEPLELSAPVLARITALWTALNFLDSKQVYQSERQYPQLGTTSLIMRQGTRQRVAEFNWTNDPNAANLASEFRKLSDQAILLFDISVARDNQPLETPKLLDQMEDLLHREGVSDPQQLATVLLDLSTDERLPLIARNHAGRILKRIQK